MFCSFILDESAFPYFKNVATCLKQDYTIPSKINRATIEALMSVWLSKDFKICFYSRFFIHEYFVSFFVIRWNDFYESCRAFTQYRPIYIQIKPVFCASTLQIWIFAICKMSFSVCIIMKLSVTLFKTVTCM